MSDHFDVDYDDVLPGNPSGELVHWMQPRSIGLGSGPVSLALAGAFMLGLAAAMLALNVQRLGGAERRMSLPLERKLRRFH